MSIEHLAHQVSEHPVLAPLMWCVVLILHTIGMLLQSFVQVDPNILSFFQLISFILASLVSICVIIGYGYKLYKWIFDGH